MIYHDEDQIYQLLAPAWTTTLSYTAYCVIVQRFVWTIERLGNIQVGVYFLFPYFGRPRTTFGHILHRFLPFTQKYPRGTWNV